MNKLFVFLLVIFLIPLVSASMNINIDINKNDVVREDFNISFIADSNYDNFEFLTVTEPLSVIYDGQYDISQKDNGYSILFYKNIVPGDNVLEFSILYDNMVENSGRGKVIRTSFGSSGGVNIKVILPEGYFLSGNPSSSPEPDSISSDGQRIALDWNFDESGSIVVFYETNSSNYIFVIIGIVLLILIGIIFVIFNKNKTHKSMNKKIDELLSEDEKSILEEVKSGLTKQKDIASKLNFSKSKMSKVVRKLEEKNLIERTPHFKTNMLKIKN